MDNNYRQSLVTLAQQSNLPTEKRSTFHHRLLVASSSLFGVLIALHTKVEAGLPARMAFSAAILSLAIGILLCSLALYHEIDATSRARKLYTEESIAALRESRATEPVSAPERKIFVLCAKAAYICFAISVLLLASYVVMISVL